MTIKVYIFTSMCFVFFICLFLTKYAGRRAANPEEIWLWGIIISLLLSFWLSVVSAVFIFDENCQYDYTVKERVCTYSTLRGWRYVSK